MSHDIIKSEAFVDHLRFYQKKYGLFGLVRLVWKRFLEATIARWEFIYCADLRARDGPLPAKASELELKSYSKPEQIEPKAIEQILKFKSAVALNKLLDRFFSRNITLWLVRRNGEVVGLFWTLPGGFDGFYSLPINRDEVIVLAVEVFPAFRGQGLFPLVADALGQKLKSLGYSRVYLKVANANYSMQRSMCKTVYIFMGRVFTVPVGSRFITIWSDTAFTEGRRLRDRTG